MSKHRLTTIVCAVLVVAFLATLTAFHVYRYRECREFGHSAIYCIGR